MDKVPAPTPYQQRVIAQGHRWIAGASDHNVIDGECCPDFSCCMPALFEPNRLVRIGVYNNWAIAHGFARYTDA